VWFFDLAILKNGFLGQISMKKSKETNLA